MSDSNNNLNVQEISRRWENSAHPYQNPSEEVDIDIDSDEDLPSESYAESEIDRNFNSPMVCVDVLEASHEDVAVEGQVNVALPTPWGLEVSPLAPIVMAENNQVLDEEDSDSESESELQFIFEEAPPMHGIRFYNPNYQPPAGAAPAPDVNANTPANATALPAINQVNNSRLDLRPVPASIDLTRSRPSTTWRDYHARVRASTQIRPAPTSGIQRLCAGQPPIQVPMYMDEEIGAYVFFRNDTDSEEEPPLAPLAMVPRRGNSVSDLSQCSSDDDPDHK